MRALVVIDARARQMEALAQQGRYPSGSYLPNLARGFAAFEREAYALSFRHAAVGALVRSSYHADRQAEKVLAAD